MKPEIIFSKLVYRRNFFKEFNWNYNFNDSLPLKNINNNKYFIRYFNIYNKISENYPLTRDINYFVNGFFLKNSNIYKIDLSEINSIIIKWNYLCRNCNFIIKKDYENLKEKNIKYNEIFIYNDVVPSIYKLYNDKIISFLSLGYLYYSNKEELNKIISNSKNKNRSLQLSIFYSDVFKSYKVIKLIKLQKEKENSELKSNL